MSRHSAKTAGRSAKSAAGTAKKATKTGRSSVKKTAKSGRRPVGKATRAAPKSAPIAPPAATPGSMIHTPSPPMQPAAPVVPERGHRYRVGETVYYTSPSFGRAAASGSYTVVKLLPSEGDD